MKARKLTKILDTTYTVADHGKYIGVGSPLCHNLFSVDKETLEIKYALDTFKVGRAALADRDFDHGLRVWDRLHELVASGEIQDILNGSDDIENPLPVFTFRDGEIVETVTDAYGWPNTTADGRLMHDNDYFPTRNKALAWGIKECSAEIDWRSKRVAEIQSESAKNIANLEADIGERQEWLDRLRKEV